MCNIYELYREESYPTWHYTSMSRHWTWKNYALYNVFMGAFILKMGQNRTRCLQWGDVISGLLFVLLPDGVRGEERRRGEEERRGGRPGGSFVPVVLSACLKAFYVWTVIFVFSPLSSWSQVKPSVLGNDMWHARGDGERDGLQGKGSDITMHSSLSLDSTSMREMLLLLINHINVVLCSINSLFKC